MDEFPAMDRRPFLITTGMGAVTVLSGCLGSAENKSPPPRKSNLVEEFTLNDGSLTVRLVDNMWVMSRDDQPQQQSQSIVWDPNPIGVASAKGGGSGGGRGFTGRGSGGGHSSAPRTGNGFIWFHGGDYTDDWYEEHSDEISKFSVTISTIAIAYLGTDGQMEDNQPGPGTDDITWDMTTENPTGTVAFAPETIDREGWYRVGTHIRNKSDDYDFDWESFDLKLTGSSSSTRTIDEKWKVSKRI